jgi:hypothetical protein
MHYARIDKSPRLQRVLKLLSDGLLYTTRDIIEKAHVVAVNSAVDELRSNGYDILCQRKGNVWFYKMK